MRSVDLRNGDSSEVLRGYLPNSIDSVCCDPPYHLTSIVKRFGAGNAAPAKHGKDGAFARASRGFMGQTWDGGDIAFRQEFWAECFRVLKPGGHLFAFSGTRTYHRMACAIEDAGFEIRDQFGWAYGTGFPKNHPIADVCSIATGQTFEGHGTAIKPAWEPICLARKPLAESSVMANLLRYGTGSLNIDGARIETDEFKSCIRNAKPDRNDGYGMDKNGATFYETHPLGRYPTNIIHDGSPDVTSRLPINQGQTVARFFYCAKASKEDWAEGMPEGLEKHPTVKPTDLMAYLCRLITPERGTVLDPFMGSGSTGKAAIREGFSFIGIERDPTYFEIARSRIEWERRRFNVEGQVDADCPKADELQPELF